VPDDVRDRREHATHRVLTTTKTVTRARGRAFSDPVQVVFRFKLFPIRSSVLSDPL